MSDIFFGGSDTAMTITVKNCDLMKLKIYIKETHGFRSTQVPVS